MSPRYRQSRFVTNVYDLPGQPSYRTLKTGDCMLDLESVHYSLLELMQSTP